jgi:dehydrogenase/reductase SDR family protein 12
MTCCGREDGSIMAHYRGTVLSGRTAEETFDYMAEFSNAAEWDPGVVHAERLGDAPVGLASTFALTVKVGLGTTPLEYAVVRYDRPNVVVVVGENDSVRSEDTITIVSRPGGGSILTYEADLRLKGALARADPLLALPFRGIGDRGLTGLRRVLAPGSGAPGLGARRTAPLANVAERFVDEVLEASVVGSFSSIGPLVRCRTAGWQPPPSLAGKVVLVTGATSGLGLATVIGQARLGATVRFVARDKKKAETAVGMIGEASPGIDVGYLLADMGELEQVRAVADKFVSDHGRLDVLVHNAGALSRQYSTNNAGTEVTVASQLVAPFLLTGLLLKQLQAARPSRVIQVSSGGMYTQRFDLTGLEMEPGSYDGTVAYAKVKRAQLVLMHEWVRRFGSTGIAFHAMHPGWADTPGIRSGLPGFSKVMGPILRSAASGADTAVWLSAAPQAVETNGKFWLDRRPRWEHKVPWTHLADDEFRQAGSDLWGFCAALSGWSAPGG